LTQKPQKKKQEPPKPTKERLLAALERIVPMEMPLKVAYEDEYLVVIDKDPGIAVHPAEGEENSFTLVNGLLFKYGRSRLSSGEAPERPGIVHRLDKDTSGLIVICKTDEVHALMKKLFQERKIDKLYYAVVLGKTRNLQGSIQSRIIRHPKIKHKMTVVKEDFQSRDTRNNDNNEDEEEREQGKLALTDYKAEKIWKTKNNTNPTFYSLVKVKIHTGRTHQIRVHMSSVNTTPIIGDVLYHKKSARHKHADNLCLVAKELNFVHPITNNSISLEVDFPDHIASFMKMLDEQCHVVPLNEI